MLVLTRKPQQSIQIADDITVSIVRVKGNTVQLGIKAPKQYTILRTELLAREPAADSCAGDVETSNEVENGEMENGESRSDYLNTSNPSTDPRDLLTAV